MWRLRDPKFTFWLVFWCVLIGFIMWGLNKNRQIKAEAGVYCAQYAQVGSMTPLTFDSVKNLFVKKHLIYYCEENQKIMLGAALKNNDAQVTKFITKYNIDNNRVCKGNRGLKYVIVGNFANYYFCNTGRYYYGQVKTLEQICQVFVDNEYSDEIQAEIRKVFNNKGNEYIETCDKRYL